jgi:hypothetical protein
MQTKGLVPETEAAWTEVLDASEREEDIDHQLRALWGLWAVLLNQSELRSALTLARKFSNLAASHTDAQDRLIGDRMIGYLLHLMGDQQEARRYIERMLGQYEPPVIGAQIIRYVFDQRATASCFLARILWLQGFADQSVRLVKDIVGQAVESKDVLSLCQVLVQAACPVSLFVGDLAALERYVTMLLDHSARQALEFWRIYGRCFRAVLQIRRGNEGEGIPLLAAALQELRQIQYGVLYTMFTAEYASALGRAARSENGLTAIDAALARCEQHEERWYFPELLRVRGEVLLRTGKQDVAKEAEKSFRQALDYSKRQQTVAWQLRAATSLAELHRAGEQKDHAHRILSSVYAHFTEGFDTADLREAKGLL